VPPRKLVREDEADRIFALERDQHQRARIGEQCLGIARTVVRRQRPHNLLVSRREQANRDSGYSRYLFVHRKEDRMPGKRPSVKNEKQYEKLKEKGMSKERAAKIANSPGASSRGGKASHSSSSRSDSRQGGTTAQKKAAGRKGGRATASKSS
jgi:hypothetical protein